MSVESLFLKFSADKLTQFADRIETCVGKLSDDQIWARGHESSNAIGNLMLHLNGNVRQWIIGALGGTPVERDRDSEFAARGGITPPLRETVQQAAQVISSLTTEQLTRTYEIQNYPVSGVEAVYHVVEHFAEHTGQIIFATKLLTGEDLGFYRHLSSPQHEERIP
jgi:uncharacterized damage-inducible protein DinB